MNFISFILARIIFINIFLSLFSISCFSQNRHYGNNEPEKGDVKFYIANENVLLPGINTYGLGIGMEYFPYKKLGLYYNFILGINQEKQFSAHTPTGIPVAGAGFLLAFTSGDEPTARFLAFASIISILMPEGITYQAWHDENITIIPFIGPLGIDYNPGGERDFPLTGTAGIRFRCRIRNNFTIMPMAGAKMIYKNAKTGIFAGLFIPIN
jgi:hypothetical protein